MKVLLDSCIAAHAKNVLLAAGYDAIWAGDWERDPGDEAILSEAYRQGRILVTIDKDFGELALVRGVPNSGILRLVNFRASEQGRVLVQILSRYVADLESGAIITAEPGKVRVRRQPL